jgi:hypothetical protein
MHVKVYTVEGEGKRSGQVGRCVREEIIMAGKKRAGKKRAGNEWTACRQRAT